MGAAREALQRELTAFAERRDGALADARDLQAQADVRRADAAEAEAAMADIQAAIALLPVQTR